MEVGADDPNVTEGRPLELLELSGEGADGDESEGELVELEFVKIGGKEIFLIGSQW